MISPLLLSAIGSLGILLLWSPSRAARDVRGRNMTSYVLAVQDQPQASRSRLRGDGSEALGGYRVRRVVGPILLALSGVVVGSPSLTIAGPILWAGGANMISAARRRKVEAACETQLLGVIDQLGHELRSGNSLANAFIFAASQEAAVQVGVSQAAASQVAAGRAAASQVAVSQVAAGRVGIAQSTIGEVDPARGSGSSEVDVALMSISASVSAGERLESALQRLLEGDGWAASNEGMRLLLVSMIVLVESGGTAVSAVDRLADTLRSRQASVEETQAQASQATASAYVLGGLPLVFGLVLCAANPAVASFYAYSYGGAACVVGSLLLVIAGWTWIDRLVHP